MSRSGTTPCPSCGQSETDHVPVWEDPGDHESGNPPDHMGCVECNTMLPYDDWWPPGDGDAGYGTHAHVHFEKARLYKAVALAVADGAMTEDGADEFLSLESDLDRARSDHYPGDEYFDHADAWLRDETQGGMSGHRMRAEGLITVRARIRDMEENDDPSIEELRGMIGDGDVDAGAMMEAIRDKRGVPRGRLQELADSWRSGTFADHKAGRAFEQAMNTCADELEELIGE